MYQQTVNRPSVIRRRQHQWSQPARPVHQPGEEFPQQPVVVLDINDYTSKAGNQMVRATFLWGAEKIYDFFNVHHESYGEWARQKLTRLEKLAEASRDEKLVDGVMCPVITADLKISDDGFVKVTRYGRCEGRKPRAVQMLPDADALPF